MPSFLACPPNTSSTCLSKSVWMLRRNAIYSNNLRGWRFMKFASRSNSIARLDAGARRRVLSFSKLILSASGDGHWDKIAGWLPPPRRQAVTVCPCPTKDAATPGLVTDLGRLRGRNPGRQQGQECPARTGSVDRPVDSGPAIVVIEGVSRERSLIGCGSVATIGVLSRKEREDHGQAV